MSEHVPGSSLLPPGPQRVTRRRAVVVVVALSVVSLLAELGYQTTAVAGMPYFLRQVFKLRMERIGLINMAFLLAETAGKIPFAALSDRYGRWPFVTVGPLLSAIAALAVTQVSSPGWVMALRALDGLGAAMLWPTLFAAIADVVDDRFRATAMSLFNLMYIGGLVLGPLTYSAVFAATNSHVAIFYVLGGSFLVCVVVAASVVPRGRPGPTASSAGSEHTVSASAWGMIRRSPMLTAMLVIAVVQFVGLHMLNGVLSIYLKEQIGISETQFGRLFLYIGLAVGAMALPMGRLADHIGKAQAIRLGLLICAVGMWILPFVHAVPLLVAAAGLFGVGFLLASPAWLALLTELAGEARRGGVVGIVNTAQGVGASLGVYVGSRLYEGGGVLEGLSGPRSPFIGSAILFTLSVLLVFRSFNTPARAGGVEAHDGT